MCVCEMYVWICLVSGSSQPFLSNLFTPKGVTSHRHSSSLVLPIAPGKKHNKVDLMWESR